MSDRTRNHDLRQEPEREAHGEHSRHIDPFPPHVDPHYYRKALFSILTKADGQADAQRRLIKVIDKIDESLAAKMGRALSDNERRSLDLQSYRDMRLALLGLALELANENGSDSETHYRRAGNVSYLQWSIEKQILMLHWKIDADELQDRQLQSGRKMSRYLSECLESEGLT